MSTSDRVVREVSDPAETGPAQLTRNTMGTLELAFFVVAAAGPLLVVAGFAPLGLMIGGIGAPGAQLVAGLVLLLFAVGFTRMALRIRNPGAFYSYIGRSLGKLTGGGAALLAVTAYSLIAVAQLGAFGAFASGTIGRLTGLKLSWVVWSLAALAVVGLLAHRRISLSARVLGVALLAEIAILIVLAVAVLLKGGPQGMSFDSFNPSLIFAGGGTGAMFAVVFGAFIGFESTAIYAEEARKPERTVPRATFLAVGFLAVFYTFMMWIAVIAFGKGDVVSVATDHPTELFSIAFENYVGHAAAVIMEILLISSVFASTLAFHSTTARYLFTLGRERLLPARLAAVHPRHGSPWVASGVQTIIAVVFVAIFGLAGADPYLQLFLLMAAPGILAVIVLQALCAIAVLVFFRRIDRTSGLSFWATVVAPLGSLVGLAVATWLVTKNFELLTGRTDWVNVLLLAVLPVGFCAGVIVTWRIRRSDPVRYAGLLTEKV
ncbi:APC family permease [Actinomadura sp. HBU206391]|uniref:APC family permease n=1 Tax=Actinomadura sp. HBU206391 TaxID=2731692 RepID=UPI0016500810|nr:APC family permease [Actinomadura sp. HBU206391]MBC6462204.1 APC family permease [Actinomadura sp. HBU206391]